MTKKEAIDTLKLMQAQVEWEYPMDYAVAIDMAVAALAEEPEIIMCEDCRHYKRHDKRCAYWNHGVTPSEWCCHAERRNDG